MSGQLGALRHYRELPGLLGRTFLVIGFVGRLPVSMVILGVLTLLTATTGSVGDAGAASSALALSTAVSGPLIGRWTDRAGQRRPLLLLAPVNAAALLVLVLAADAGAPLLALVALCAAIGLTTVPVGSLTRVRWLGRTTTPTQTTAALGYESMVDELVFVLGPAVVGLAASLADPRLPVLLAGALVLLFVTALGLHPSATSARPRRDAAAPAHVPFPAVLRAVAVAAAGMACVGLFFGATQTSVTAFAGEAGRAGTAGLVYALMGIGSAGMSLAVVALPAGFGLRARLLVSGAGVAALSVAMAAAGSLTVLAWLVLAVGFLVGPALVTLFTLAGRLAPTGATASAMTALASANVIGVAVAAPLAGALADGRGAWAGFVVAAAAGLALAVVALLARGPHRVSTRHDESLRAAP